MLLRAPKGMNSVSLDGKEYKIKKGLVEVPDNLGMQLLDHGLTVETVEPEEDTNQSEEETPSADKKEAAAQEEKPKNDGAATGGDKNGK